VILAEGFSVSGLRPFGVATDGVHIWLSDAQRGVIELDAVSGTVVRRISDAIYGFAAPNSITTDGVNVWVGNLYGGSVSVFPAT